MPREVLAVVEGLDGALLATQYRFLSLRLAKGAALSGGHGAESAAPSAFGSNSTSGGGKRDLSPTPGAAASKPAKAPRSVKVAKGSKWPQAAKMPKAKAAAKAAEDSKAAKAAAAVSRRRAKAADLEEKRVAKEQERVAREQEKEERKQQEVGSSAG